MAAGTKRVIYAALVGNFLIAVTKFAAASYTGSSAMLSEGIHSLVDTGNQGLLLHGMRRARRPADKHHPFGYGAEVYFWAFVVAILIFAVGAGVSIYEGVLKILDPHEIESPYVNYIVLALAMVFEGVAWVIAYREFQASRNGRGFVAAIRQSKDPTVFTVLFEDTAAMLGLIVALIGVYLATALQLPWLDGAASIGIGLILAATAVLLAIETKGLLIGEAADPQVVRDIRAIVEATPTVDALNEIRTLHRGPSDILLAISVDFEDNLTAGKVEEAIQRLEVAIKERFPAVRRLFIEVQSAGDHRAMQAAEAMQAAKTRA
ncbi:cation diffusion facilitator family transporter [Afifella pfennigii]|uniref:cation diffusion facilitator family transporter n=1 Tax=Afifella pfennigii TaxID=209897 RepID=UPI000557BE4B|nr:cation diffusion facilitator family transporter [Afifella pfennigii]